MYFFRFNLKKKDEVRNDKYFSPKNVNLVAILFNISVNIDKNKKETKHKTPRERD